MKRLSFADIAALNLGQVFYEEEHGVLVRLTLSRVPIIKISHYPDGDWTQVEWRGKTREGEELTFLMTKEFFYYGPYIFRDERGRKKKHP